MSNKVSLKLIIDEMDSQDEVNIEDLPEWLQEQIKVAGIQEVTGDKRILVFCKQACYIF